MKYNIVKINFGYYLSSFYFDLNYLILVIYTIQGGPKKSLRSSLQPKLTHKLEFLCHILFLYLKTRNFC